MPIIYTLCYTSYIYATLSFLQFPQIRNCCTTDRKLQNLFESCSLRLNLARVVNRTGRLIVDKDLEIVFHLWTWLWYYFPWNFVRFSLNQGWEFCRNSTPASPERKPTRNIQIGRTVCQLPIAKWKFNAWNAIDRLKSIRDFDFFAETPLLFCYY